MKNKILFSLIILGCCICFMFMNLYNVENESKENIENNIPSQEEQLKTLELLGIDNTETKEFFNKWGEK